MGPSSGSAGVRPQALPGGGRGGRAAGLEDRPHGTDAPLQESHFSFAGKTGHLDGVRGGRPPSQVLASLLPSPQPVRVSTGPWPMSPEESSNSWSFSTWSFASCPQSLNSRKQMAAAWETLTWPPRQLRAEVAVAVPLAH